MQAILRGGPPWVANDELLPVQILPGFLSPAWRCLHDEQTNLQADTASFISFLSKTDICLWYFKFENFEKSQFKALPALGAPPNRQYGYCQLTSESSVVKT